MRSKRITEKSLALLGWSFEGPLPREKKYVLLALPHTSNWDGLLLVLLTQSVGLNVQWMVKDDWVKSPLGGIIRRTGGVGVNRSKSTNMVDSMIEQFRSHEQFILAIPPEGTRSRAEYWKSGFYRIALGANVPVATGYLDFARKRAGVGPALTMTGNVKEDMDQIRAFYEAKKPVAFDPSKFGPIRLKDENEALRKS